MQFMGQSMGWADNIILAMGPLGIITVIVGAIRVGAPPWLKAIIGRARETRAVAEAELMSSTSNEVCELWNGRDIVRVMGAGPIREFIILLPDSGGKKQKGCRLFNRRPVSEPATTDSRIDPVTEICALKNLNGIYLEIVPSPTFQLPNLARTIGEKLSTQVASTRR